LVFIIFVLTFLLFSALVFWSPVLEGFITPLVLVVWYFIRILILSIDQKIIWGIILDPSLWDIRQSENKLVHEIVQAIPVLVFKGSV
jgi:hypothetical protein